MKNFLIITLVLLVPLALFTPKTAFCLTGEVGDTVEDCPEWLPSSKCNKTTVENVTVINNNKGGFKWWHAVIGLAVIGGLGAAMGGAGGGSASDGGGTPATGTGGVGVSW